jgi:hypothetical protein
MKPKMIVILIMTQMIISCITVASPSFNEKNSVSYNTDMRFGGNTLIIEHNWSRVIEVDSGGSIVWEKTGLNYPWDAERLTNGNTLITDSYNDRVIEVDSAGNIVWEKTGLMMIPFDAERLENGNTLITEFYNYSRVIEVDSGGNIVWEKTGLNSATDAERLENGNTLITEYELGRIIEVDSGGNIVWEKTGLIDPLDAERLDNENTLITEYAVPGWSRVIEVNVGGSIVWEKTGLNGAYDAERLSNGNTLIAERFNDRVIEVDSGGNIVWEKTGLNNPYDVERISEAGTSNVIVEEISGGLGIKTVIKNIGDEDATNVSWSIDIEGTWITLRGGHAEGVIDVLGAGESETIRHSSLFAIGKDVLITVTAGEDVKNVTASWIIGPLVIPRVLTAT